MPPVIFLLVFCLTRFCYGEDIPEIARIVQGKIAGVTVPSGISSVTFIQMPKNSKFCVLQFHTPYNPVLVSTLNSFDSEASQSSSHSGLVSILSESRENITLFIYSSYDTPIQGWARVDAYSTQCMVTSLLYHDYTRSSSWWLWAVCLRRICECNGYCGHHATSQRTGFIFELHIRGTQLLDVRYKIHSSRLV